MHSVVLAGGVCSVVGNLSDNCGVMCVRLVRLSALKAQGHLAGARAAFNGDRPQLSARPGVQWACLATSQHRSWQSVAARLGHACGVVGARPHIVFPHDGARVARFAAARLRRWPCIGSVELCHNGDDLEGHPAYYMSEMHGGTTGGA